MKVIIAGSRSISDLACVEQAARYSGFEFSEVVCGMAPGADKLGYEWAKSQDIPVKEFPAKWRDKDGVLDRAAGFHRNTAMAQYADALVAVWDGKSNGTGHMIRAMSGIGKPVYVYRTDQL